MKKKFDEVCVRSFAWVESHKREVALGLLVLGVILLTSTAFAQSGVEGEMNQFAQTLRNILVGPVAKTLAVGCFIGAGIFFMLGKIGIAIGCIVGGIFLGFAERIAEAVFK